MGGRFGRDMTSAYSFIDIAVIDGVRQRFAAGDALVLLDEHLESALWANGPGAALFGHGDIESTVGAAFGMGAAAKRQIMGTPAYRGGPAGQAMVRLGGQAMPLDIQRVTLPDRAQAVLVAAKRSGPAVLEDESIAALAISGFSESGYFLSIVDHEAGVVASTPGFALLGISRETLAGLIADVRTETDRLVKRLVRGGDSSYPAGFARLAEDPLLHLLVVVDEPVTSQRDNVEAPASAATAVVAETKSMTSPAAPSHMAKQESAIVESRADVDQAVDAAPQTVDAALSDLAATAEPERTADGALAGIRSRAPVRFLWRTGPDGRFNAVSDEFVDAVGLASESITGKTFAEIADDLGVDPNEEISGLLARRDTWSGRSVMWPLADGLSVPVDLAALPAYSRNRSFEGFRGFGIVRFPDAIVAPASRALEGMEEDNDIFGGADYPLTSDALVSDDELDQADLRRLDERPGRASDDPFRGEVPALKIEPLRDSDAAGEKVIRLAERRQSPRERVLSPVERNAFREIGNRLRGDEEGGEPAPFGKRKPEDRQTQDAPQQDDDVSRDDASGAKDMPAQAGDTQPEPADSRPDAADGSAAGATIASSPHSDASTSTRLVESESTQGTADTRDEADRAQDAVADLFDPVEPGSDLPEAEPTDARPDLSDRPATSGRDVLDRLPVPVLIHAGDTLHFANAEFLELTDYESVAQLAEAGGLETLFSTPYDGEGEKDEHQLHLRTKGGDEFPIEALLRSVPWGAGKALMLVVRRTGDDAADDDGPALAEARMRISEMRAIIDTATDGVVLIDPDGSIRSISRPGEALFGFESEDLVGKPFTSLFAIESQRTAREYLSGLSDHGVASVLNDGREVIGREAQGRFIPLFMTIGRLPDNSGYCAVVRDVTQWKRAEEELSQSRSQAEKASSQKTDFLARVSHEIRTPLNAIIGFSELMIDEKFGPIANDRYRDYLRDINRSGNHVLDLVNDLLDISKIEAGEQEMAYEAVSLNEALAEAVAIMQPQANRERVIIRSSFATKLPEVVADLRSIRQIALNVLSNAVRFTQAGGQVIISTAYEPNGDIAMRVRDTGIGMSQAEIEQALKPFKQINALKRTRGDGTGLGLPLTKAMVEANRAKFTLTSAPGEGTLVEVMFPSTRVLAQ
jgi:PAS domain S-box-containing protein